MLRKREPLVGIDGARVVSWQALAGCDDERDEIVNHALGCVLDRPGNVREA
jgi:hypothetical protein